MSAIEKNLDEITNFILNSREELKKGNVVSLDGFQVEVANICAEIGNMPISEMSQLAEKLGVFSEQLELLENELKTQQDAVQQEIFDLNKKQKALKSYESTSHSDKKDDDA